MHTERPEDITNERNKERKKERHNYKGRTNDINKERNT